MESKSNADVSNEVESNTVASNSSAQDEVVRSWQRGQNVSILSNENASPQAKLKAAEKLYEMGEKEIKLKDKESSRTVRLEVEQGESGKKMVHVFAQDERGKEHVVLRGIDNGNGKFQHEVNENGKEQSFNGDWWAKHEKGKSNLAGKENGSIDIPPVFPVGPGDRGRVAPVAPDVRVAPVAPDVRVAPVAPDVRVAPVAPPEAPAQGTGLSDRIVMGPIAADGQLPEKISVTQEGRAAMTFERKEGQKHYVDSVGNSYRMKYDQTRHTLEAIQISDPSIAGGGKELSRTTWLPNGSEIRKEDKDGTTEITIKDAKGKQQIRMEEENFEVKKAELTNIDGSTLKLDKSGDEFYDKDGNAYSVIDYADSVKVTKLDESGKATESTTYSHNGDIVHMEGTPLLATAIKVAGKPYQFDSVDHKWKDAESHKEVDVTFNGRQVTVKDKVVAQSNKHKLIARHAA